MTKNALSKTQIDRLGERLKGGSHTENDLRLLDEYRSSFGEAYEVVARTVRERGQSPTGRLAKSTQSIVEKLRRESIRLSQMQDIAGCRIVVTNVMEQGRVVAELRVAFPGASVIDRRDKPSHGYRAIHVIAVVPDQPVEIQVRTELQHLWAELSEKSSDIVDPAIKYGGGPKEWRDLLARRSEAVAAYENFEGPHSKLVAALEADVAAHVESRKAAAEMLEHHPPDHIVRDIRGRLEELTRSIERDEQDLAELRRDKARSRDSTAGSLSQVISWLDERRGKEQKR